MAFNLGLSAPSSNLRFFWGRKTRMGARGCFAPKAAVLRPGRIGPSEPSLEILSRPRPGATPRRAQWIADTLPRVSPLSKPTSRLGLLAILGVSLLACAPSESTGDALEVKDPQAPPLLAVGSERVGYQRNYEFSNDWFSHHTPVWKAALEPYRGQPGLRYLEVGLWEGRSLLWMLDNVLTHPSSRATGIDIVLYDALEANLARSGAQERVTLIEGSSQRELRKLEANSQDVIYIDGSHTADDVLEDLVLAWPLLRAGGLLILDDYGWDGAEDASGRRLPDELLPRIAIDAFISAYRSGVEVLHKDYQVVLRRHRIGCPRGPWQCSSLGRYAYDWSQRQLYGDGKEVALEPGESELIEALIHAKTGDGRTLAVQAELRGSPALRALDARLGLGLF